MFRASRRLYSWWLRPRGVFGVDGAPAKRDETARFSVLKSWFRLTMLSIPEAACKVAFGHAGKEPR
jgi:hypothetical protein